MFYSGLTIYNERCKIKFWGAENLNKFLIEKQIDLANLIKSVLSDGHKLRWRPLNKRVL